MVAVVHANSTGMFALLDGMVVAGIEYAQPNGDGALTCRKWESGIRNLDVVHPMRVEYQLLLLLLLLLRQQHLGFH